MASYFPEIEDIELEDTTRLAHQPVQYQHMFKFYKEIEASFWTDEDIDKDNSLESEQVKVWDHIYCIIDLDDMKPFFTKYGCFQERRTESPGTFLRYTDNVLSVEQEKIL